MQNISETTPQKIQNILVRRSCSTRIEFFSEYQHPEADYLKKYSPKYYHSLILETTRQSPLLSKIKKIKKLKKFTGLFKAPLPQKLWLNLLANHNKEIEEIPLIVPISKDSKRPPQSFWKRLIKCFSYMKRVSFSPRLSENSFTLKMMQEEYLESTKTLFVLYVGKLRKLKDFEIPISHRTYQEAKWMIEKSDRMSIFFSRLERLKISIIKIESKDLGFLKNNKHLFLHVTEIHFEGKFQPIFSEILDSYKNLKSLSFNFPDLNAQEPKFIHFLTSLQHLFGLKNLESVWKKENIRLWKHFRPPASLQCLKLELEGHKDLFGKRKPEDFGSHWGEMKDLEELELDILCWGAEDILLMRRFITTFLKKTRKLRLLKIDIRMPDLTGSTLKYEPFFIEEETAYLYESLERFEHRLQLWSSNGLTRFDLGMMKPFRNLKELKLAGSYELYENIDQAVILLEENQKKGEYPVLELNLSAKVEEKDRVVNTLDKIEKVKRIDRNLKILMALSFQKNYFGDFLEDLFSKMQSLTAMKGLTVWLQLFESADHSYVHEGGIRKVLKKYPQQIRNLMMKFENEYDGVEYIKIEGEKEQIFQDRYW